MDAFRDFQPVECFKDGGDIMVMLGCLGNSSRENLDELYVNA